MTSELDWVIQQAKDFGAGLDKNAQTPEQIAENVIKTGRGSQGQIGRVPLSPPPGGGGGGAPRGATYAPLAQAVGAAQKSVAIPPPPGKGEVNTTPFHTAFDPKRGFGSDKNYYDTLNKASKGDLGALGQAITGTFASGLPNLQEAVKRAIAPAPDAQAAQGEYAKASTGFVEQVGKALTAGLPKQGEPLTYNYGRQAEELMKAVSAAGETIKASAEAGNFGGRALNLVGEAAGLSWSATKSLVGEAALAVGVPLGTAGPLTIAGSMGTGLNPFFKKATLDALDSLAVQAQTIPGIGDGVANFIRAATYGDPTMPPERQVSLGMDDVPVEMLAMVKGWAAKAGLDTKNIDNLMTMAQPDQAKRDKVEQIVQQVQSNMFDLSPDSMRKMNEAGQFVTTLNAQRMGEAINRLDNGESWDVVQRDIQSRLTPGEFFSDVALSFIGDPLQWIGTGGHASQIEGMAHQAAQKLFVATEDLGKITFEEPKAVTFLSKFGKAGEALKPLFARTTSSEIRHGVEEMANVFSAMAGGVDNAQTAVRLADIGITEKPTATLLSYLASDGKIFRTVEGVEMDAVKVRDALGLTPHLADATEAARWGIPEGTLMDMTQTRVGQNLSRALRDMSAAKDTQMLDAYANLTKNLAAIAEKQGGGVLKANVSAAEWQEKVANEVKTFMDALENSTWKLSGLEKGPTKLEAAQKWLGVPQKVMAQFQIVWNPGNPIRNALTDTTKLFLNHVNVLTPWRDASKEAAELGLITSALGRETAAQAPELLSGGAGGANKLFDWLRAKSPIMKASLEGEMQRQVLANVHGYNMAIQQGWKDAIPEFTMVGSGGKAVTGWNDMKKTLSPEHYDQLRALLTAPPRPGMVKDLPSILGYFNISDPKLVEELMQNDMLPEAMAIFQQSNGTIDDQVRLLQQTRMALREQASKGFHDLPPADGIGAQVFDAQHNLIETIPSLNPAQKQAMVHDQQQLLHTYEDWYSEVSSKSQNFLAEQEKWAKSLRTPEEVGAAMSEIGGVKNQMIQIANDLGVGRNAMNRETTDVLDKLWKADNLYRAGGLPMDEAILSAGIDPTLTAFSNLKNPGDMWSAWRVWHNDRWREVYQDAGKQIGSMMDKYATGLGRQDFIDLVNKDVRGFFVTQNWKMEQYNNVVSHLGEYGFDNTYNFQAWLKKKGLIKEGAYFSPYHIENQFYYDDLVKQMQQHGIEKAARLKEFSLNQSYAKLDNMRLQLGMEPQQFDQWLIENHFMQPGQTAVKQQYKLPEGMSYSVPIRNQADADKIAAAVEDHIRHGLSNDVLPGGIRLSTKEVQSHVASVSEHQGMGDVVEWSQKRSAFIKRAAENGVDRATAIKEFEAQFPSPGRGMRGGKSGSAVAAASVEAAQTPEAQAAAALGTGNYEAMTAKRAERAAADAAKADQEAEALRQIYGGTSQGQAAIHAARERALDNLLIHIQQGGVKTGEYTAEEARALNDFVKNTVQPRFNEAHIVAKEVGKTFQDALMFNYGDKFNFDTLLAFGFNYPGWYARNMAYYAGYALKDPSVVTSLFKLRAALERANAGKPDWWKDQINVAIGGTHMSIPILNAIDPLNSILGDKFYDKDMAKTGVGGFLQNLQNWGPGLNTNVSFLMAAQAQLSGDPQQASAWFSSFGPPTNAFRALTAVAKQAGVQGLPAGGVMPEALVEPWLNSQDAAGNPFVSGTKYDQRRWGLALSQLVDQGKITQEQAYDLVSQPQGPLFEQVRQQAEMNVAASVLGSFFLGAGFRPRDETEMEVAQMDIDRAALISAYNSGKITTEEWRAQWNDMREKYKFMDYVIAFRKDPGERDRIYAWSVFDRLPPNSSAYFQALGFDTKKSDVMNNLLDQFYANKGHMDAWTDYDTGEKHPAWNAQDKEFFMATMHQLGAVLALPKDSRPQEWALARQSYSAMRDALSRKYDEPGANGSIFAVQDAYFNITDAAQAKVFLQAHPRLQDMWNEKDQMVAADPTLMKYYGSLDLITRVKTDDFDAAMEKKYPGVHKLWDQYDLFKQAGDTTAASAMFKQYPQMKAYLTEKDLFNAGLSKDLDAIGLAMNNLDGSWAEMRTDLGATMPTSLETIGDLVASGVRPMGQFDLPNNMDSKQLAADISVELDSADAAGQYKALAAGLKKLGLSSTLTAFQAFRNTGTVAANKEELAALRAAMGQIREQGGWKLLTKDSDILAASMLGATSGKRVKSTTYYATSHHKKKRGGGGAGASTAMQEQLSGIQSSKPLIWRALVEMSALNATDLEAYLAANVWIMDALQSDPTLAGGLQSLLAGVRALLQAGIAATVQKKAPKGTSTTIPAPPKYSVPALNVR